MKKISVVVPCYNVSAYLDRCMEHLINQTIGVENIEIILVDDASTDMGVTWKLITQYERQFPESIIAIALEENLRQGGARNVGISYASGEYLMFCDADDWLRPEAMEILYNVIQEESADVVEFRSRRVYEYTDIKTPIECGKESYLRQMRSEEERRMQILGSTDDFTLGCWNKIYRMSLIQDHHIRFAEHLICEEPSFTLLVRMYETKHIFWDMVLYYYFQTSTGTVQGSWDNRKFDNAKVWMILRQDLVKRGFWQKYPIELEYMFWSWGIGLTISMLIERGYILGVEELIFLKETAMSHCPDIRNNPYLLEDEIEWNALLLTILSIEFTKENIQRINKDMRQCLESVCF